MSKTEQNQGVGLKLRGKRPYLSERKPTVGPDYLAGIQRAELANAYLTSRELVKHRNPRQIGIVNPQIPSTSLRVNLCPGEVVLYRKDRDTDTATVDVPYSQQGIQEKISQGSFCVTQTIRNVPLSDIRPIGA